MLSSGAGRRVACLLHASSRPHLNLEPLPNSLKRVNAAYNSASVVQSPATVLQYYGFSISSFASRRGYATRPASRPKAHTGRATASRSKKTAISSTDPPTKDVPKSGSKAKSKPKTKAKPKAKAKAKAKAKPLTDEQKLKAKISELKKTALKTPSQLPANPYLVLNSELSKENKTIVGTMASEKYKNLSPEEREHYNHIANQNKAKNDATYEQWLATTPPIEIYKANLARAYLTRLGVKGYSRKIRDPRAVKRPATPSSLFLSDRFKSGEMKGLSLSDAGRLIGREWRELPQASKKKYWDAYQEDKERYAVEMKSKFGVDVTFNQTELAKAVSAA